MHNEPRHLLDSNLLPFKFEFLYGRGHGGCFAMTLCVADVSYLEEIHDVMAELRFTISFGI